MGDKSPQWWLCYSTLVGWQCHPGYLREGAQPRSLVECARLATQMEVIGEEYDYNNEEPDNASS